ncbi:hypothetical protein A0H81_03125 [Grifola frondosa]|uniref:DUF4470 domain-containing protein n=1 Tax=Grifola frondosa TaxID=5627 RepID=A0A1C7MHR2_GRIFR|nr:hypothetical protein A0H81_03125 [Grifola frondosa]
MPEGAPILKEKGNVLFKAGKMADAAQLYAKAEKADQNDPVYPSNLSAALFEVGDYAGCVNAVLRSWKLLRSRLDKKPDLILRLSIRLAKALCHGFRSGAISADAVHANPSTSSNVASTEELAHVWQEWKQMRPELADREAKARASLANFSRLPILIKNLDPTREYYSIGQDEFINILEGWGPSEPFPMKLDALPVSRLSSLAFFYGGVGDARHTYATVVGLHRAFRALSKPKQTRFRAHITLNDVHPAVLARDLCILMLLNELIESKNSTEAQIEIKAALMYTFAGVVMPSYCYDRLHRVIRDLHARLSETPVRLPAWLHVVSDSIPVLLETIDYWALRINKPTWRTLQEHSNMSHREQRRSSEASVLPGMAPGFANMIAGREDAQRASISKTLTSLSDSQLREMQFVPPGTSMKDAREFIKDNHDMLVDFMLERMRDGDNASLEEEWYDEIKVFLPPPELRKRHPGFEDAFKRMKKGDELSDATRNKLDDHIEKEWKTNVTLFDLKNCDPRWGWGNDNGYPLLRLDVFAPIGMVEQFNNHLHLGGKAPKEAEDRAFRSCAVFFDAVADAIKGLSGRLTLEILVGGLSEELAKMKFGADQARPSEFPREFTRMWLSNVPDYVHGPMNMALYVVPSLQNEPEAAAACNCLLNTGAWNNDDEFTHNYTLLHPDDISRYLGCRIVRKEAIMDIFSLAPLSLPRPLAGLASREELVAWLTRILLNTLVPGRGKPRPHNVRMPHSVSTLFRLLIHLHRVGFPGHWLSEFVGRVLSGSLVTDIAPYRALYPIPLSDFTRRVPRRRVRLDPWQAEFENIVAVGYYGFPFPVSLPPDFAREASDIGVYEAVVHETRIFKNASMFDDSPFEPISNLLFYRANPSNIIQSIPSVLEGRATPAPGTFFILTTQEFMDYRTRIRWRMSKRRVEKMKEEKWSMVAFRTDTNDQATIPVPVSKWVYMGSGDA